VSSLVAWMMLAVVASSSAAFAASSEQSYITARDKYLAKFKAHDGDQIADPVRKDEERARKDLAGELRRALGPTGVKGFSADGTLNLLTLFPESEDSDAIDGLVIASDDGRAQLLLTTPALIENWLRRHREVLVNNALEMGSKDPIKKVLFEKTGKLREAKILAWLGRHKEVAQDVAHTITSELFYSQMFNFGAAVVKYADIPLTTPATATTAYSVLIRRQQDIGPYTPDEIIVTLAEGPRVYVLSEKPEVAIEMFPECDAIWQAALSKRAAAYESERSSKANDDALADKPVAIENAGDKAFHRCFAEKAKSAGFYAALKRQAQGLVERVGRK
jgi:hypothetical protein